MILIFNITFASSPINEFSIEFMFLIYNYYTTNTSFREINIGKDWHNTAQIKKGKIFYLIYDMFYGIITIILNVQI